MQIGVLTAKLGLDYAEFKRGTEAASSAAQKMAGDLKTSLSDVGKMMTVGLTLPILGIGAALLKVGSDFDDAFDRIRIGTGQTGAALDGLEQSFRNVVADVPATFEKASEAITQLAQRTGLTGAALETLTKQELELSRITGTDLAGNIAASTRAFGDWSIAAADQGAALDFLFKTSQQTGIGVTDLTDKVVQFGAPMRALGFSFEESAALMGKWEKEGVNMDTVLSGLRQGLNNFSQAGVDPAAMMKIIIERMKSATDETKLTGEAFKIFGARAAVDMFRAMKEGRFDIDNLVQSISKSHDSIMKAGADTQDFTEELQKMKNQAFLAAEPLANELFKAVNDLMPAIKSVLGSLASLVKWFTDLPDPVKKATAAILATAAVAGPIAVMASSVIGALGKISAAYKTAQAAAVAFRAASLAGLAGGGGAAGLGAIAAVPAAAGVGAFLAGSAQWEKAKAELTQATEDMGKTYGRFTGKLITETEKLGNELPQSLKLAGYQEEFIKTFKVVDAAAEAHAKRAGKTGTGADEGYKKLLGGGSGAAVGADALTKHVQKVTEAWDKVSKMGQKLDLDTRKDLEDMVLSSQGWAAATIKATSMIDVEMTETGQFVKKLQADWTEAHKLMEDAEHTFAQRVIANLKEVATVQTEAGIVAAKASLETRSDIESVIKTFEDYGAQWGLTGRALDDFVENHVRTSMSQIPGITKEAVDAAVEHWKEGLIKLPGVWGEAFNKLPNSLKGPMASTIGIIDTMPGHFGDAARKILKTAEQWVAFADQVLKSMHSLNKDIPDSLGGLVVSVGQMFKKIFSSAQKAQEQGQQDSEESANKWAARITGIIQGAMMFMSTRHQGKAMGVMGGAMAGLTAGAAFGPLGAGIGAGIGAIAGLFGSGKSAEQKAEEERQKKQMAMDMEKQAIDITSAAIDSMHKALDMFKELADHVDVPRAAIKSFFATLEKVTKEFLSLAGKFAKDNMEAAKTFAESMQPVIETMAGALTAFEGLRFYTAIPAKAIEDLAADIGKAADLMGELALDIETTVVKKAMKFSKQMQIVVEMIGAAVESFVKLQDYKGVATYIMGWFFQDLQTATDMMGEIADNTSRNMLNKAKVYAERIGVIVQAIGVAVTSLTSLRTYESVPQMAFDALQHDIIQALSMIDGLVSAADMYLDKALTFEELVKRIVGALDSGVSLIRSVGGSAFSGGVTVTPGGDTSSIRSSGGSSGSTAAGGLTIQGGVHFSGNDPRTQRAIAAFEDLFGSGGFPLAAKAY